MKNKDNHLDDLVAEEQQNSQPTNQRNRNGDDYLGYLYTPIGLMFTALASTQDNGDLMYPVLGVGFCLAGVVDAAYSLYRKR